MYVLCYAFICVVRPRGDLKKVSVCDPVRPVSNGGERPTVQRTPCSSGCIDARIDVTSSTSELDVDGPDVHEVCGLNVDGGLVCFGVINDCVHVCVLLVDVSV